MAKKPDAKASRKLESFNRSQEIYRVLEKGIIESEALLNSSADRPEDDAHIGELLESTTGEAAVKLQPRQKASKPESKKSGNKGRR
ncbi:MAG: hypothetical protein KGH67_01815 [Candidatus Micrarchaeota archaeon]|nr:hypothetical protein [Candidatus Micrarchaeota archaeon]MDE1859243.1 hypothetical protein [Candidatus Micrarchaeota archaeon]